jgi:hypothetical protein
MYFHGRNGRSQDTAWRKEPMKCLADKTNKYMKKSISWTVPDIETLMIPQVRGARKIWPTRRVPMDDWLEFLGWYLSEGHLIYSDRPYTTGVGISQKASDVLHDIYELCARLGMPVKLYGARVRIHNGQIARYLAQFGKNCLEKAVPDYARQVSDRQLNILLDAYVRGDGYRKGSGEIVYTSSPSMADCLQEMILKTGRPSVIRKRELVGRQSDFGTHVGTSSADGYVVTRPGMDSKIKFYPENARLIDYDGMVYCATVPPEHLLLTRRDGYTLWSGDSSRLKRDHFTITGSAHR